MAAMSRPSSLTLYPEPIQGPDIPYKRERKHNPRLSGWALLVVAYLVEQFEFLRRQLWRNAGFGSLTSIRGYIADVEPRFDPTVYPARADANKAETPDGLTREARGTTGPRIRYSAADYRSLYLSGELTPLAVARALLPLIRRDLTPPGKHSTAWLDVRPDLVIKAAEASTLRYREKRSIGNLDGVPTGVKDEYDMEGYRTCLGTVHDLTGRAPQGGKIDSWVVQKLEEAGAVILGKLTMVEIGMDTCGVNPHHGTPLNPYNEHYYTGGSSSGCAYAVATGLVPFAMGSDGGGSIRIPSSFCSVFGLKPSLGRISYHPRLNASSTAAVNGPVAADIQSLADVYAIAAQPFPPSPFPAPSTDLLDYPSRQKVIGVPEEWLQSASPAIQKLFHRMIDRLVSAKGYSVIPISIPFISQSKIALSLTMLTNAATHAPDTRGFSATSRILVELGRVTPASDYLLAQKLRHVVMSHLAWLWKTYPGMVIATPTTACAGWPIRTASELKYGISDGNQTLDSMEYIWLANFCGVPSLTIPAGYVVPEGVADEGRIATPDTEGKVPIGFMATGEWTREDTLLLFGLDAEEVGRDSIEVLPPTWVDVVDLAKKEMGNE